MQVEIKQTLTGNDVVFKVRSREDASFLHNLICLGARNPHKLIGRLYNLYDEFPSGKDTCTEVTEKDIIHFK